MVSVMLRAPRGALHPTAPGAATGRLTTADGHPKQGRGKPHAGSRVRFRGDDRRAVDQAMDELIQDLEQDSSSEDR